MLFSAEQRTPEQETDMVIAAARAAFGDEIEVSVSRYSDPWGAQFQSYVIDLPHKQLACGGGAVARTETVEQLASLLREAAAAPPPAPVPYEFASLVVSFDGSDHYLRHRANPDS